MNLRQSTAVAIAGRALLIEGPPGSGKSSLALALIDRGAVLIGDDGVSVQREGDIAVIAPAPATDGLFELRGVDIIKLPTTRAPAALILLLGGPVDRYPQILEHTWIAERAIPVLGFDPVNPAAAIRAEYALAKHGLSLRPPTVQDFQR